jgi:hypothetical protein
MPDPKRYLVILTMQRTTQSLTGENRTESEFLVRAVTPEPGWTRLDLLTDAQAHLGEHVRGGIVLFFSAEPLELT